MADSRTRAPWRRHAPFLLPPLLLAIAVHAPALGTFFARDDIEYLSFATGLARHSLWLRPLSGELMFRAERAMFGLDPFGFHVVSLLLHLADVAGVYLLAMRWSGRRGTGAAAAVLFGVSGIAFTPLHWAASVGEPLMTALLLAATWLVAARPASNSARWAAAGLALTAMFAKETAVGWGLVVAMIEWPRRDSARSFVLALAPAAAATAVFVALVGGQLARFDTSLAYQRSLSPVFLGLNLATYARWCFAVGEPIRDRLAVMDPAAWRAVVPLAAAVGLLLSRSRGDVLRPALLGLGWWIAFLLPVLPLEHHSYLYYLYAPWAGGAIAAAAIGRSVLEGLSRRPRIAMGLAGLGVFALIEANGMRIRESATLDALPIDPTMREALLLRHSMWGLRQAALPRGARVLFVNPVPRGRIDLTTGAETRPQDLASRTPYFPLEAAMHGGLTLRLFVPQAEYAGFVTTIPPGLEDDECFWYEQRGWLRPWGHGASALRHQAEIQRAAGRWASAESTDALIRALGGAAAEPQMSPSPH